jgi:hypothetical protein
MSPARLTASQLRRFGLAPNGSQKSKYRAKGLRDPESGEWFASKREYNRWGVLLLLQKAGKISHLRRQVRFPLVIRKVKVGVYVADFVYREGATKIVEDAKGVPTPVYQLKKKLMAALYGIQIRET